MVEGFFYFKMKHHLTCGDYINDLENLGNYTLLFHPEKSPLEHISKSLYLFYIFVSINANQIIK